MAKRKSKATDTPTVAPATTEDLEKEVADTQAKAAKETSRGETPVLDQALERGYLGTVPEAGIEAGKNADLRSGTAGAPA
jgi:hypothetical protein